MENAERRGLPERGARGGLAVEAPAALGRRYHRGQKRGREMGGRSGRGRV